LILVAPSVASL
jgi:hypothetical protein